MDDFLAHLLMGVFELAGLETTSRTSACVFCSLVSVVALLCGVWYSGLASGVFFLVAGVTGVFALVLGLVRLD